MITHDDILFVITTVVLFLQGFYFGRKQILRLVIVSLMMLLSDLVSIMLNGMHTYSGAILDINIYEATVVVVYVFSFWGIGYMAGHGYI